MLYLAVEHVTSNASLYTDSITGDISFRAVSSNVRVLLGTGQNLHSTINLSYSNLILGNTLFINSNAPYSLVGIGTSNPTSLFEVNGNSVFRSNIVVSNVLSNLGNAYFASNVILANSNSIKYSSNAVSYVAPITNGYGYHVRNLDPINIDTKFSIGNCNTTSNYTVRFDLFSLGVIENSNLPYERLIIQANSNGANIIWNTSNGSNRSLYMYSNTIFQPNGQVVFQSNIVMSNVLSNLGNAYFASNIVVNSNLYISGNTTLSNTLSNLNNAYFASNVVINSNFFVSNNTVLSNTLSNLGNAYFASNIVVNSNLYISGNTTLSNTLSNLNNAYFASNVVINSNFFVSNNTVLSNTLSNLGNAYFASNIVVNSNLYISGNTTLSNTLSNLNNAYFASNVAINGILTVSNVEYITSNITIYSSEVIQSNLTVQNVLSNIGNAYFASNVIVNSNLFINQNVTVCNVLSNLGNAYFASNVVVNKFATLNGGYYMQDSNNVNQISHQSQLISIADPNAMMAQLSFSSNFIGKIIVTACRPSTAQQTSYLAEYSVSWYFNTTPVLTYSSESTQMASTYRLSSSWYYDSVGGTLTLASIRPATIGSINVCYQLIGQYSTPNVFKSSNNPAGSNLTPVFSINSNNNIGVNTSNPQYNLDVSGSVRLTNALTLFSTAYTNANYIIFNNNSNAYAVQQVDNAGANYFRLGRNGFGDLAIASNGYVGIGTTNPFSQLMVTADATGLYASDTSNGQLVLTGKTNTNLRLGFGIDTTSNIGKIQAALAFTGTLPLCLNAAGGNVGVGTSTPQRNLEVVSTMRISGFPAVLDFGSDFNTQIYRDAGCNILLGTSSNILFNTNGTQRMLISSNVGIGTTTPAYTLDISGTTRSTKYRFTNTNSYIQSILDISGASVDGIAIMNNASSNPSISAMNNNGYVGIGTSNPQYTLDVNGSQRINSGNLSVFNSNMSLGTTNYGLSVGVNNTIANCAQISFTYVGSNSYSNYIGFGFNNISPLVSMLANGYVGIGTTTPAYNLDVSGTARAAALYANSYATPAAGLAGGAYMMWNRNGGSGATTFANQIGGGNTGGFEWVSYNNTAAIVTPTPSMFLDPYGNLTVAGSARIVANNNLPLVLPSNISGPSKRTGMTIGPWQVGLDYNNAGDTGLFFYNGTNSSSTMILSSNNNVGIGTTTPAYPLDVNGTARVLSTGTLGTNILQLFQPNLSSGQDANIALGVANATYSNANISFYNTGYGTSNYLELSVNGDVNSAMVLNNVGVGIGTSTPAYNLDVAGSMRASNLNFPNQNSFSGLQWPNAVLGGVSSSGQFFTGNSSNDIAFRNTAANITIGTNPGTVATLTVCSNNNVGILTPNPTYNLDINGTCRHVGNSNTLATNSSDGGVGHNILLTNPAKSGASTYSMAIGVDYTSGNGYINSAGNQVNTATCLQTRGGAVGVGTTAPAYTLDVNGSFRANNTCVLNNMVSSTNNGSTTMYVLNANNGNVGYAYALAQDNVGNTYMSAQPGKTVQLCINSSAIVTLSNGMCGVNTTSPAYTLDVNGTFRANCFNTDGTSAYFSGYINSDMTPYGYGSGNIGNSSRPWKGVYSTAGSLTVSDEREKKNITEVSIGLDFVCRLKPKKFQYTRSGNDDYKLGFVAQDILKIEPEYNGLSYDKESDRYVLSMESFVVPLVNSVKELRSRVQQLQKENIEMRSRLDKLTAN